MTTVSAIFKQRSHAEKALHQLDNAGFNDKDVSFVMSEQTRDNYIKEIKEGTKAEEGVANGAALGGLAGAVAGILMAAGAVAIPGLNLIVTGALVSSLAGLGAGALTGGLVGGLIGAGIPEHEAKYYAKEIENGNFLITVQASGKEKEQQAREIFSQNSADRIAA